MEGNQSFMVHEAYKFEMEWGILVKWEGWKKIWSMRVKQWVEHESSTKGEAFLLDAGT